MGMTTIKIDTQIRDHLAEVASRQKVPMGAMVEQLLRVWEEQEVFAAYARLQEDPEEWASYLEEREQIENASLADFNARMAEEE